MRRLYVTTTVDIPESRCEMCLRQVLRVDLAAGGTIDLDLDRSKEHGSVKAVTEADRVRAYRLDPVEASMHHRQEQPPLFTPHTETCAPALAAVSGE